MSSSSKEDPAFYRRRKRRGSELGQLLIKRQIITGEQLREALARQAEFGGHIGAILREMGACSTRDIADALVEQSNSGHQASDEEFSPAHRARESPSMMGLAKVCRPKAVLALLIVSDVLALCLGAGLVGLMEIEITATPLRIYGMIALLMPMCMLAFAATHLYGVPPPAPHEELRRATLTTTLIYGGSWVLSGFMVGSFQAITWSAWLVGWGASVICVPMFRGLTRATCGRRDWWGFPVVVMGAGKVGREVVINLKRRPELGLKPLAILDNDPAKQGTLRVSWGADDIQLGGVEDDAPPSVAREVGTESRRTAWEHFTEVEGVPILGGFELAPILSQRLKMEIAVIADPALNSTRVLNIIEAHLDSYSTVLVIPDLFDLSQFGAPSKDLAGVLGIEVRRQLLLRGPRVAKRLMDISLTLVGGVMLLPLLVFLGLLVKFDSPGGAFYRQKRLGQDGIRFEALKFRTMYGDGEARLKEVLAQNPEMAEEYEKFHKLTDDPRVTRAGRVLRKYSLDELPQIWNVLMGEMSLVGPRPYLPREIPEMSQQECMVLRAKPGITGYWQVTERNSSTFKRRVQMDVEYVRNWSPWLDIYVLARTVPVVLGGTGS